MISWFTFKLNIYFNISGVWLIGLLTGHLISFRANKILKWFTTLIQNTFNDIHFTDLTPLTPTGLVSSSGSGCICCSQMSIPGPIPDRSNVLILGSKRWLKRVSNQGMLTLIPSKSQSPTSPSQSLPGIDIEKTLQTLHPPALVYSCTSPRFYLLFYSPSFLLLKYSPVGAVNIS